MAKAKSNAPVSYRTFCYAIFAFAFLLYANSIGNGYALDDKYVTVTNPQKPDNLRVAKGIAGIPEIFSSHYVESETQSFDYRPLPQLTFAVEYQFFGSNANINHFFNVVIYAFSCVLVFLLLMRLFKNKNPVFPLLVTLLFVAHPIHTEVVNNIKCRDELLSFLLGSLSLFYFLKYLDEGKNWKFVLLCALFLLMALLCKKTALLFAGLILLAGLFFRNFDLKRVAMGVATLFGVYLIYFFMVRALVPEGPELRNFTFYENPLYFHRDLTSRLQMALFTTGYYLRLLLVPYPLCFYYGYNAVPMDGWASPWVWLSLAAYGAAIVYVIKKWKQKDIFAFGILVFLMGLAPFTNLAFPVVGILGERFVYFSSFGFCIACGVLLFRVFKADPDAELLGLKKMPSTFKRVVILVLAVFSGLIVSRNTSWKDLITLSVNDEKHFPGSYMIQAFVANNLYAQGMGMAPGYKRDAIGQEARRHFALSGEILAEGLKENPEDHFSMTTLGTMYSNYLGRPEEAAALFRKALQKDPGYEVAQYNLIYCYELTNRTDTALLLYEKMLAGGSFYQPLFFRLHDLYVKKNELDKARLSDQKALTKYPNDIQLNVNLGNDFMLMADTARGLFYFEKAAALAPGDYNLLARVAETFNRAGYAQKANEYRQKAAKVKP